MKDITKISAVIIGTIIGGGFISGQEIYIFFNKYNSAGIMGMIIAMLLISFIIYKTYKIADENNIENYEEFLDKTIPGENKILKEIIKNIINIFLALSFFMMCNAFSTYCYEIYSIPPFIGGVLVSILLFIVLLRDIKAIIKVNEALMPLAIIFIIIIAIMLLKKVNLEISYSNQALIKGILYANYNCITLIPIIVNLKRQIKNKKQMKSIVIITFCILLLISLLIFEMQNNIIIENVEMPLIIITKQISNMCLLIYGIITQIAIFTSAISSGYSFVCNFNKNKKAIIFILCAMSIPFSLLKFPELVNLVYPVFGILGILQIFFLIKT